MRDQPIEQIVVDHMDTEVAYRAAKSAYEREEAKDRPDPERLAALFERVAELQSQLGDLEDAT